jgi:hypothetical protein
VQESSLAGSNDAVERTDHIWHPCRRGDDALPSWGPTVGTTTSLTSRQCCQCQPKVSPAPQPPSVPRPGPRCSLLAAEKKIGVQNGTETHIDDPHRAALVTLARPVTLRFHRNPSSRASTMLSTVYGDPLLVRGMKSEVETMGPAVRTFVL